MTKLIISCKKDDNYVVKVNKKRLKTRKIGIAKILGNIEYEVSLEECDIYTIVIRRRFFCKVMYFLVNIICLLGLLDSKELIKLNNKMRIICKCQDKNDNEIRVNVSSINNTIDNRLIIKGEIILLEKNNINI